MILMWDEPKKKLTKEEWAQYGFEDGPTGGYMPNMSDDDNRRWKAKLVGVKKNQPQVEIRRQCGPSLMLIIVNLGTGYNHKSYSVDTEYDRYANGAEYDQAQIDRYMKRHPTSSMIGYYRENPTSDADLQGYKDQASTRGINIHISANGPLQMTFDELSDMNAAIEEAKEKLRNLP